MTEIPAFTREQFDGGLEPYEYLYKIENNFEHTRALDIIASQAGLLKIRNFKKRYQEYCKLMKQQSGSYVSGNVSQFEGQELELNTGRYLADEGGVSTDTPMGEVFACPHPIMPVGRLINIDTGIQKVKLAYRLGKQWRNVVVDRRTIATSTAIVSLADLGIGVTSETAKYLVSYLHEADHLNQHILPEHNSVSRLGWISDEGFSPYVEELVFDGELNYKNYFESVQSVGSYEKWKELVRKVRQDSIYARIILAASFSSVLVEPLGCLPFFTHLWGGTEVGKTVALMLAASVWANPSMGSYIHTFNSTTVGQEKSAGFVNSLPLIFDELQIIGDKKNFDQIIYMLSEGVGRSRGAKTGGLQRLETWRNCILTSGEMPITGLSSGGGAVNRIVEIECQEKLFKEPREAANTIRRNYGHAGREFVEILQKDDNLEYAGELYKALYSVFSEKDTTEKQSMAASLILTADILATRWIFKDNKELKVEDILDFLQTKASVNVNQRAYEYICEYVVQNIGHFNGFNDDVAEVWGRFNDTDGGVYIIRNVFETICQNRGFNATSLLSWLKKSNLTITDGGHNTKPTRINGKSVRCVFVKLPQEEE